MVNNAKLCGQINLVAQQKVAAKALHCVRQGTPCMGRNTGETLPDYLAHADYITLQIVAMAPKRYDINFR
jgi:hypothetical protein